MTVSADFQQACFLHEVARSLDQHIPPGVRDDCQQIVETVHVNAKGHVDDARKPWFAMHEHGLAADDQIGKRPACQFSRDLFEQPFEH